MLKQNVCVHYAETREDRALLDPRVGDLCFVRDAVFNEYSAEKEPIAGILFYYEPDGWYKITYSGYPGEPPEVDEPVIN